MSAGGIGWLGIVRLGLVQAALGAIVVLTTSTLNRVMVVELALPAIIPGALVALHYGVQVLRPRLGYGSDVGGRRTPWIIGGMACLALGGTGAAMATALMATHLAAGLALAVLAFLLVGVGVGAAGTSVLVLLAKQADARRRAPAATILWLMMIAGIAGTAIVAGKLLDPFTPARLVAVAAGASGAAFMVALLAVWGIEGAAERPAGPALAAQSGFARALREVWAEPQARRFAVFVFVSMLAYSAQDLILEPFAGEVFGLTPGQSTGLSGVHHGGVLAGMALVAVGSVLAGGFHRRAMRAWTIGGCLGSAAAILALAVASQAGPAWPLRTSVLILGTANGAFAIAAIGSMMGLAGAGRESREGTRMGLWGAAQALAFGAGGLVGTGACDLARAVLGSPSAAYAAVFTGEAILFLVASRLAAGVFQAAGVHASNDMPPARGAVQPS